MPPSRELPDIVRDARIEAEFLDRQTAKHARYKAGTSTRHQQLRKEKTWTRSHLLSQGAYGIMYLEYRGEERNQQERAVKEIGKSVRPNVEVDY
ncbi:mitogen-activated protein kinase kinase kinase 3 [Microdochium nivale]|nr:mitogen-activated protein kinase kinase kinase 3 [Microdochium nivale]